MRIRPDVTVCTTAPARYRRWPRTSGLATTLCAALLLATEAHAGPDPVVGGPLLDAIASMPAGHWKLVNQNLFSAVWTPAALRPLNGSGTPTPSNLISAWSGFAWDTRRGDLLLYGGGHANYSGNDVYRFRSSTLSWERAALPSEITRVPGTDAFMPIDGADAGPASAHTYDNNVYLPGIDRFMTFGGAVYNTGGVYVRPDETVPGSARRTGPYWFDPSRADPWKVGGSTGSHVRRVAPYAEVVGGNMWENRDHTRWLPGQAQPGKHVNGCTAQAEEAGQDVVYVAGSTAGGTNPILYRYAAGTPGLPYTDAMSKVGAFWNGTGGKTVCAYDPERRLFVRTGKSGRPFIYWDLTSPGEQNRDVRIEVTPSIAAFLDWATANERLVENCGLDHDPIGRAFLLWCGGSQVFRLLPPAENVAAGWIVEPQPAPPSGPTLSVGTGILGKWKYVPGFDVFVALQDSNAGNVWIYKPLGWTPPLPGDAVNFAPRVRIDAPISGSVHTLGDSIAVQATASDADGTVARVDFLANGTLLGSRSAPPWSFAFAPATGGTHTLTARVVDNESAEGVSSISVAVQVLNQPPNVSIAAPLPGSSVTLGHPLAIAVQATDPDGTVQRVVLLVNGSIVAEDAAAPFAFNYAPAALGRYTLTARAIDNRGLAVDSAPVSIDVVPAAPGGTTVTLQQGMAGYAGVTDTMLSSYHPSTSFANRTTLLAKRGNFYADLFHFAVFAAEGGPVPDGMTITSAHLEIHKKAYPLRFRLHAMLKPWVAAQATWQRPAVGTTWAVPGAGGADSDHEAIHDAEVDTLYASGWMKFDVTERIRAYAAGTPNLGWRLTPVSGTGNEVKLMSSEYPDDPGLRPRLTVTFAEP